jgi:hypothetical protein
LIEYFTPILSGRHTKETSPFSRGSLAHDSRIPMTIAALLSLLAATAGASPSSIPNLELATVELATAVDVPQGRPQKGKNGPGGGTPEPASMLLLVGSAVGYGVYRLRRGKTGPTDVR